MRRWISDLESGSVTIATVVVLLAIGISHPAFLSPGQLLDVIEQSAFVGILAAGVAFLLSMREIDLSVGSIFGVSVVAGALLDRQGWNPWLAALACIIVGALAGLFNAVLVQGIAIPAIIATLGTLSMFRGLAQALTNGEQITGLPTESSFFTIVGVVAHNKQEGLAADPRPQLYLPYAQAQGIDQMVFGVRTTGAPLRTGSDEHSADELRPEVIFTEKSPR
mgnify:CR=1 FL=1